MKKKTNWWKDSLLDLFEEFRQDFVQNDDYRGLDLDFSTTFCMKTGLSLAVFNELNMEAHLRRGKSYFEEL